MLENSALLITLLFFAVLYLLVALRHRLSVAMISLLFLIVTSLGMYGLWGEYQSINQIKRNQRQAAILAKQLKEYNGIDDVIKKMSDHLAQNPNSSKGWFLLGRLYTHQGDLANASRALSNAYALKPDDLKIQLQYMEILYLQNNQQLAGVAKTIFDKLLKQYPNQLDILNFAAADAYTHNDFKHAIDYWQKMLGSLSEGSKERAAIEQAIAKARKQQTT